MAAKEKKGLGTGLDALFGSASFDDEEAELLTLPISKVEPRSEQPRKYFDETALEELAASLKAYGMIQPIVVKKNGKYYEIIAGERRWRAAKIAGMEKVPVVLKAWEGSEAFEAAQQLQLCIKSTFLPQFFYT
mgnify:CR=1 FL=1